MHELFFLNKVVNFIVGGHRPLQKFQTLFPHFSFEARASIQKVIGIDMVCVHKITTHFLKFFLVKNSLRRTSFLLMNS